MNTDVETKSTECCGFREIYNITTESNPEMVLASVVEEDNWLSNPRCSFYFFTDSSAEKYKYGKKLKEYIEKHKLGTVHETLGKNNPNSSNRVRAYIWTINHTAFTRWAKENYSRIEEECERRYNEDCGYDFS